MKKLTSLILTILMLAGMLSIPALAAEDVSVYLFGEKLSFDVPPQIINGRTLVPMRKIFEELGATVDWDKDTRTVTSVRGDKTIILTIDSNTMYVNGEAVTLDTAPCIVKSKTMVPARAVSESFDLKVGWDNSTRSVLITDPNSLDKEILAKIGDYEITQAYYNCMYYVFYSSYSQFEQYFGENWITMDAGDGITIGEMIDADTKAQIEHLAMATVIAKDYYGITSADVKDEVKAQMEDLLAGYGNKEKFKEFLFANNMTEKGMETYIELYAIFNLLTEKTAADGKVVSVANAEVEKLFKNEFEDKMKVQHILVSTQSLDGITPARTDEEAKTIVNEILKKLGKGEDFGKLIDEYDEDPGMTSANYYTFGEGEMVPEFETASKKLAVGSYTKQAVKSSYGYHIIKRYALDKSSDEFKSCKMQLIQNELFKLLENKVEQAAIQWNN